MKKNCNGLFAAGEIGDYYLSQDDMPQSLPGVPHCDCPESSEVAGVIFNNGYLPTRVMTMHQVTPTIDDECPYCKHTVFYRPREKSNKNYAGTQNRNKVKREPKPALMALPDKNKPKVLKKPTEMPNSKTATLTKGIK